MKKRILLGICFVCSLLKAQDISEMTFTENDKEMEAFGFTAPVCNKTVLVAAWKDFIKKHNGKPKGGIINKITGTNLKFNTKEWNGSFAYNYGADNRMTIFTSFYDMQGEFLTIENNPEEALLVKTALGKFKTEVKKACYTDDINHALGYKNSLNKEKIQNINRINLLETSLKKDSIKLNEQGEEALTQKQVAQTIKTKQNIASHIVEKDLLAKRNLVIDQEVEAQDLVIENFQVKIDRLINPEKYENIIEEKPEITHTKKIINENIENIEKESEKDADKAEEFEKVETIKNIFDR